MTKKNPRVFMDVSIDGSPVERMIFELFSDVAPYTAENFRALCTGEKGISPRTGRPLHYKGSFFHHIVKGSMAQGGDFYKRDGTYGESIYGEKFPGEPSKLKHENRGLLSMAIADRETRGSLFTITFKALHHLDRKNIVFGKLVKGHEVLKKIENARDGDEWTPAVTVKIINCGEYFEAKKESHKSKNGKEASLEDNSLESRKRGKHKRTLRDRRKKRRKYYSSESESSSDTETESSDSDSDSSISSSSSSSDFSSSSDDRRKKRKRSSRRNKYKRGKRREKRRDRKRRRRDKRPKHKSKRSSVSSESGSSEDNGVADINGKGEHHKHPAQINEAGLESFASREAAASVRNQDRVDVEREEGEYPRENGEQLNNGVKLKTSADGCAYRPDVLDDHPGKSRSRSITPKRATSKSMSISPRRSLTRSLSPRRSPGPNVDDVPGVRPKTRSVSQSPAGSGSISPVRRVSTSLVSGKRGRSASRSPTISPPPTRRSLSRSPPRTSSRKSSRKSVSTSPIRVARQSVSRSPIRSAGRSISRSPVRSLRSASRSPVRVVRKSVSRSPVRSSRRSVSRSPIRSSRRSISRSPVRSRKSVSRSSGRAPSRRSISPSPVRGPTRNNNLRSHSRSPVGSRGSFRERSLSRSRSPDGSPKRIRRGRGFSDRYSYARRYRSPTPDRSPVRSYRYSRSDRDRYSRRSPPRRYRSPPRRRSPPRYRSRKSRTRSPVSWSPVRYRGRRYSRSPVRSPSPVAARVERRRSLSHSSASRSSRDSPPPKRETYVSRSKSLSRSSSGSPPAKKGLVSYDDGTPDSGER